MAASAPSSAPRPTRRRVPLVVLLLALVGLAYILVPIVALGLRVPWAELPALISNRETRDLLALTLNAAVLSSIITVILGVGLAVWMQSLRSGSQIARLLVLLPLAMPPVVGGLALSAAIGNRGIFAPVLDALGIQIAFEFVGVVVSHIFVSLPFVVVAVDSALRQMDPEVTASASGIGMSPWRIFSRITLPTIAPSIATGFGLAFARSLGEFGTTITFAGSMPGVTRTMSIAIYLEREVNRDNAYGLAAILIILAILVLVLASLPALLRREEEPRARSIGEMDIDALRDLTRPEGSGDGVQVKVGDSEIIFPKQQMSAVIGPNGSGKSTLLAMIAGRLTGATVSVGGRGDLAPHERGIVLLTQKPGLPRFTTVTGAVTMATRDKEQTRKLLDASGLSSLAEVPVSSLSGGQAAQVALIRALATRPSVLLLDEPLAAIDVESGMVWRRLLRATARDRTTVMVSHDAVDVAGMSDWIVVMQEGAMLASGPTRDILAVPPNDFVARLAGVNRYDAEVVSVSEDTVTMTAGGLELVGIPAPDFDTGDFQAGQSVVATASAEATSLRLSTEAETTRESIRNAWPGTVLAVNAGIVGAATVVVRLDGGQHMNVPITRASAIELALEPGTRVECLTKALAVSVHPRD